MATIRGPNLALDYDFTLSVDNAETIVSGGSSSQSTIDDSVLDNYIGATIDVGGEIHLDLKLVAAPCQPSRA